MKVQDSNPDVKMIAALFAAIIVPAFITLHQANAAPPWSTSNANPTPHGYTISLALFVVPLLLIVVWHALHGDHHFHRRSLAMSAGIIAIAGFVLDLVFGADFLRFDNTAATLGWRLPGLSIAERTIKVGYLPIEEFGFYVFGGLFIVAFYSWIDADWLHASNKPEYLERAQAQPRLLHISGRSFAWWLVTVALGFFIKRSIAGHFAVPGYFLFLMVVAFLPAFLFLKSVSPFINWSAFAFTAVTLLLISLLWEVTLGVPYGWWGYQDQHMLGVNVRAWGGLPIEAVLVWLVVTWDAVIAYEVCRVFLHMDRPARVALFGPPGARRR